MANGVGGDSDLELFRGLRPMGCGPTTRRERIGSLDIVRGFALLGVFLINWQQTIDWAGLEGTLDGSAVWFLQSMIAGKFYRLFAFLFGVGFVIQIRRFEARGAPAQRIYLRRVAVLFLFGMAHGLLLWPNDVLALYAQLGVLLLLLRRLSNRWLITVGMACLFAAPVNYYVTTGFADFRGDAEQIEYLAPLSAEERNAELEVRDGVRSEGGYPEFVVWTSAYFLDWQTNRHVRMMMMREEFLMFLLGLYAGRCRLFGRAGEKRSRLRWAILGSFGVGLASYLMAGSVTELAIHPAHGHLAVSVRGALRAVQRAAFALLYGLTVLYLVERFDLRQRLRWISSLGRTALTNYLLLSVLVVLTFYDFGLDLYGRVSVVGGIGMAVASYVGLAATSSWWLARFHFGPTEWVWRSLTYGQLQPMRRSGKEDD